MLQTLKKQSLKKVLPGCIAAIAVAVALLCISGFGIFRLMAGAVNLDSVDEASLPGSYVSVDYSRAIIEFATLGSSSDSSGENTKQYYIVPLNSGKYMALEAGADFYDRLDTATSQAEDYYHNKTVDTLNSLGTVNGTVISLDSDIQTYLQSALSKTASELPYSADDMNSLIVPYSIHLGYVGWLPAWLVIVMSVLALLLLLYAIVRLALVGTGFYQRGALMTLDGGDEDFTAAEQVDRVRIGTRYLWYTNGAKSMVVPIEELLWGYCQNEPLVVSKYRWPMTLYRRDGSICTIFCQTKQEVDGLLSRIQAQGHPFISGYSAKLTTLFETDFDGFCALAEQTAAERSKG